MSAQRKFQLYDFVLCFTNSDRITKQLEEEQQARKSAEERIKELEGKYQETRNDSGTAHTRGKIKALSLYYLSIIVWITPLQTSHVRKIFPYLCFDLKAKVESISLLFLITRWQGNKSQAEEKKGIYSKQERKRLDNTTFHSLVLNP